MTGLPRSAQLSLIVINRRLFVYSKEFYIVGRSLVNHWYISDTSWYVLKTGFKDALGVYMKAMHLLVHQWYITGILIV